LVLPRRGSITEPGGVAAPRNRPAYDWFRVRDPGIDPHTIGSGVSARPRNRPHTIGSGRATPADMNPSG
jgi:hypothetical protein